MAVFEPSIHLGRGIIPSAPASALQPLDLNPAQPLESINLEAGALASFDLGSLYLDLRPYMNRWGGTALRELGICTAPCATPCTVACTSLCLDLSPYT